MRYFKMKKHMGIFKSVKEEGRKEGRNKAHHISINSVPEWGVKKLIGLNCTGNKRPG